MKNISSAASSLLVFAAFSSSRPTRRVEGFSTSSTTTSSFALPPHRHISSSSASSSASSSSPLSSPFSSSSTSVASSHSSSSIDYPSAIIDVSEDAERNIMAFDLLWSADRGLRRCDGFKLVEEDRESRNVYAITTLDVPRGSTVLFVPENLILSSNRAMGELRILPDMELAESTITAAGGGSEYRQYYLMLKILYEVQNGKDSPWYQWLNSLPRYFTNAPSMTDYCLLCLPPLMRKLAEEERDNQRRLSDVRHVPFLMDDIKYHPRDLVRWAYQIVYTRSVSVYDENTGDHDLRIVPMADYFNHGSEYTEIDSHYDEYGNYYATSRYDVPGGSPLRIQYADPRNPSHLLARYGFLDDACPATYCKLLPPTMNSDMLDLGYSHERMLFYRNGEVSDEVWDIFLYNHLTSINANDDVRALMDAHRSGDYATKLALHESHYPATSRALLEHVDTFIEDIDRLIAKAETIGVSDPGSIYVRNEHPRLPLIHRHNLFVRETFRNVRDRYDPSPNAENNWRDATRVTLVMECDESECAIAECMLAYDGEWACEGGLGPNPDGSERMTTRTLIESTT